jgi:hypothetical protein
MSQLLPGRLLQGDELLVVAGLAEDEDAAALDGDRADAVAQAGGLPRQGRPLLGPLLELTCFLRDAVAFRPAPLRPVAGGALGGRLGAGVARTAGARAPGGRAEQQGARQARRRHG